MGITKLEASGQIARLGQMVGYPRRDEAIALNELVVALQGAASVEVARGIISEFLDRDTSFAKLEDRPRCPTAGDIRRAIAAARAVEFWEPQRDVFVCELCQDTGLVGGTAAAPWSWCTCRYAKDRQRKEPQLVDESNVIRAKVYGGRFAVECREVLG